MLAVITDKAVGGGFYSSVVSAIRGGGNPGECTMKLKVNFFLPALMCLSV